MIRSLGDMTPSVADSAYVDTAATVIGNVCIEERASVWPGAVLRADNGGKIIVKEGANVQDNVVCHGDAPDEQCVLEERSTVGHSAIVHNATVGERALVGMNAVVLDHVQVGNHSVVAANSLVTKGTEIKPLCMVAGSPAEVIRDDLSENATWFESGDEYVKRSRRYKEEFDT